MRRDQATKVPNRLSKQLDSDGSEHGVAGQLRRRLCLVTEQGTMHSSGEVLTPEGVGSLVAARELRRSFFNADLLREPAWDMLLYLFVKELEQKRVRILDLCLASGVAETAAMRWIRALESENLLIQHGETLNYGAKWIELSTQGSAAMRGYLRRVL